MSYSRFPLPYPVFSRFATKSNIKARQATFFLDKTEQSVTLSIVAPADAATSTGAITSETKGVSIMTDDTIKNDCQLQQYAEAAAKDIVDEIKRHGGDAYDMAHEHANGSEHVI